MIPAAEAINNSIEMARNILPMVLPFDLICTPLWGTTEVVAVVGFLGIKDVWNFGSILSKLYQKDCIFTCE